MLVDPTASAEIWRSATTNTGLSWEVSKPTRAILEGVFFDNGVKVRKIVSVTGDTETSMKRTLLDEAYNRVGLEFDDSYGLGEWEYEKLNLEGTAATA